LARYLFRKKTKNNKKANKTAFSPPPLYSKLAFNLSLPPYPRLHELHLGVSYLIRVEALAFAGFTD